VAIYHELGVISIFDMMSDLAPVRKRGRPTTREKALEHDRDLEDDGVKKVKPSAWLKPPRASDRNGLRHSDL
jgi:hypothetical protein